MLCLLLLKWYCSCLGCLLDAAVCCDNVRAYVAVGSPRGLSGSASDEERQKYGTVQWPKQQHVIVMDTVALKNNE